MDVLRILEDLYETIKEQRTLGRIAFGFDKDEILMQISKVRASLPQEVKQAAVTVRESDRIVESAREDATVTLEKTRAEAERILADARKEADRLVEEGRVQQQRLVAESEIMKLAKAQAEEVRNLADRDASDIRRGVDQYATDVLGKLEHAVGRVAAAVDRAKQEMSGPDHPPGPSTGRDRRI